MNYSLTIGSFFIHSITNQTSVCICYYKVFSIYVYHWLIECTFEESVFKNSKKKKKKRLELANVFVELITSDK